MAKRRLTDVVVRDARPRKARYELHDTTGLSLRITPKGEKSWYWRYRANGVQRRLTFGIYPRVPLATARQALEAAREAVKYGNDPALEDREARRTYSEGATVAELAETYLERHARVKKKPKSAAEDERILRATVIPVIGELKVVDVTRSHLSDLIYAEHARIVAQGGKGIGANRLKAVLSKMFRLAIRWGWVENNPASELETPAPENERTRVLSDDEMRSMWHALESPGSEMDEATGLALRLILVTGQRPGEVAGMRRSDVDLRKRMWTLPDSKNKRPHLVPLSALALDLIGHALKGNENAFVFPSRAGARRVGHIHRESLSRAAYRLSRRLGEPWAAHDLRRSCATRLGELGASRFVMDRVLNHVDQSVTGKHYDLHDYEAEKREDLDKWAAEIERLVGIERSARNDNVVALTT